MDYKYIEQLLQRYWECETSLEEEAILRAFFSQKDIPQELLPYASLFQVEEQMTEEAHLSADFDERVRQMISAGEPCVKAKRIRWSSRLRPLFKAAALIAIFLSFGMAIQHGWRRPEAEIASVDPQPGDSTSIEIVDEATAETGMPQDSATVNETDTY
ncbi:MAG: pyruvate ferredoxin oxidoreductase [Prevotellaceae bacterium]|nr:pyruvate ferredoxin oxidoreductase [Prevotellaceae bacterium]